MKLSLTDWMERALDSIVGREPLMMRRRRTTRPRRRTARQISRGFEPLEERRLLAVDLGQISGTVFSDLTGDGQTADDVLLSGVTVELFNDLDSSGTLNAGDTSAATTPTDASGDYEFEGLVAGDYLVQVTAPAGFIQMAGEDVQAVTITPAEAMGTAGVQIDSFATTQEALASSAGPTSNESQLNAPEVLGGAVGLTERDLFVQVVSGSGEVKIETNFLVSQLLQLSTNGDAVGTAKVTWDGTDASGENVDPTGLGTFDLTEGGQNTALELMFGAEQTGAQITLRLYTDADNFSEETIIVPDTGGAASASQTVFFVDFDQGIGATGEVTFSSVGAIEMEISSGGTAVDVQAALIGAVGPTVKDLDFRLFRPLSLGDLVWGDANNNGEFDPGTESGIAGVTVNLFEDDGDGSYTDGVDALLTTDTTDGTGNYLFEQLFPGDYILQVAESNFLGGGVLDGRSSSTGNDPAPDPDDDVNNDDNGTPLAGFGVVTSAVTISTDAEPTTDGDADNDTNLTVDFGFFAEIDLQVAKTDDPDAVVAGTELVYTIIVTNTGPSTATGVTLTDTLPSEVTYVDAIPSQGTASHNGGVVTANLGSLASLESATVTIMVAVDPGTTGTINNTVTVSANENDTNPSNDIDIEPTIVVPEVDLAITKVDDPDPIIPTNTLTYTLIVANDGPSDATGVVVTDNLPGGVTYVNAVPSQGTASEAGGVLTVNLGDMDAGASENVTVTVTVDAGTSGTINNTAVVTANEDDIDPANNTAIEPTLVTPQIDLAITKNESTDPVAPGETFNYSLEITNNGPSDATDVTVTDTLPSDVTYVDATPSQGTAGELGGVVIASLGDLASGDTATVTITVTVDSIASGILTNTAEVLGNEAESITANNMDSEQTTIQIDPATIAGFVYVDTDDDGVFDAGETPLAGVTIILTGTDYTGAPVIQRSTITAANGAYQFTNLLPGIYTIQETQPGLFPDGQETIGSEGGTATDNQFSAITLGSGDAGTGYNFGELPPTLSKRDFLAST